LPPASFTRETSPDTLFEWDSLAHVRLMAALEERLDLVITPEDQVDMLNFELIGDVLEGLIKANG
jgi:acyl carrier protein